MGVCAQYLGMSQTPAIDPCTMRDELDEKIRKVLLTGQNVTYDGTSFGNHNIAILQNVREYYNKQCIANSTGSGKASSGYGHVRFGRGR